MPIRTKDEALDLLRTALDEAGVGWETAVTDPYTVVATLPGTRKLSTTCALRVGDHTLSVNAFVIRRPDENHQAVYRWLLERNTRLYGVAYAIDSLGDVYLAGRLPLEALTDAAVDRLLGTVLANADEPFNTLLELGFATAIRREWEWRTKRGESTRNLAAFAHLAGPSTATPADTETLATPANAATLAGRTGSAAPATAPRQSDQTGSAEATA